ncbi:MAG: hypothetical protein A3E80_05365 [Chlamydiae bacterium RIFCSPHIGHO2_12_FULL_49_9]|nr:MAG: hypothetical protein A3E80_05365 [Chlamydiae bacterium RIFCSPHIGHO2_12_FULL_49_9]
MTLSVRPRLYQDVLELTFSFLTGPELAQASAVNQVWKETAKVLWPHFLKRDFDKETVVDPQKEYGVRFKEERNFGWRRMKIDDKIAILYSYKLPLSPCNKRIWGSIKVRMVIV